MDRASATETQLNIYCVQLTSTYTKHIDYVQLPREVLGNCEGTVRSSSQAATLDW